jgi:hypothetical protein
VRGRNTAETWEEAQERRRLERFAGLSRSTEVDRERARGMEARTMRGR